jgi:putative peptidoglycan lipid II flippase
MFHNILNVQKIAFKEIKNIYHNNLFKESVFTTIWGFFGRGIGFLIPFIIAARFGVSDLTDIFFFAYGIIFFISEIFARSIETNIVPFISEMTTKKDLSDFINEILVIIVFVFIIFFIILISIIPFLKIITRFPINQYSILTILIIEMSPLFLLYIISGLFMGILNSKKIFILPAVSRGVRAIICIIVIMLFKSILGIHSIAIGYILGEIFVILMFIYRINRKKIIHLKIIFKKNNISNKFIKILSFQIFASSALTLHPIIDRVMASWLGVGSVSILQYAERLYFIPVTIVCSGTSVVLLSNWSLYNWNSNFNIVKSLNRILKIFFIVGILLSILLIILSRQIVYIAFNRGGIDLKTLILIKTTFVYYMLGCTFYIINQAVINAHTVLRNTSALMKAAIFSLFIKIIFNIILLKYYNISGIALSTTIASIFTFVILYYLIKLKYKSLSI